LKAATLDGGLALVGDTPGKYAAVFGFRVKDGGDIDKAVRGVVRDLPAEQRDKDKFDFARAGSVDIHRAEPDKPDAGARALFGDSPHVWFAFREDALLLAFGGDPAEDALKNAVRQEPRAARVFHLEMALARLAPLIAEQQKGAVEAARKAFDKKGSDRVSFTVEGGKALRLRARMKAEVIKFGALLDEARKKDL
jgi:hypothetical protein